MYNKNEVLSSLDTLISRYPSLDAVKTDIFNVFDILYRSYSANGKLLCCGNGGSAADCEHIVGELMKSFKRPRPLKHELADALKQYGEEGNALCESLEGAYPAISLCGHNALSTAFGNDKDPFMTFAQQVVGYGSKGDVLLSLTTSGNSKNCVYAAITAKSKGMKVVSITGEKGGRMKEFSDICIRVPERETYLVQELTLPIYHWLCAELEITL